MLQVNDEPTRIPAVRGADFGIILSIIICLAIVAMGAQLLTFELAPNPGIAFHYEWQLAEPDFWSRATIWIAFGLHQLLVWWTVYYAQKRYAGSKYSDTLRPINLIALAINTVFIVLHYAQTYFFYDAMAQDIPSWTAQYAVIMMLVVIVAMENRRRGIFLGKKVKFRQEFYRWLKEYHPYAFSFAVIYTFWFHPMIPTVGHLLGFVQVILVMVQGSLMFTKIHVNRRWMLLLEIMVLPHAAFVAYHQGTGIIYMFMFGFMTLFVVTQMHGLGWKPWLKNVFYGLFALTVLFTYTMLRQPYQINEVIRIPAVEYLTLFAIYGLWWVVFRIGGRLKRDDEPTSSGVATAAGD
ncbi:MAG: hypothetical protein HC828_21925 [Blastochloris sp.]|nr:hypothetical protein [Blastochloris sp.]